MARGMEVDDFRHYVQVENMHTIIGLLKRDCGISFMYKVAVAKELEAGTLKEIVLSDFKMQHETDEFHQLFVPGRSGQIRDVLIDSGGVLTGLIFICFVNWLRIHKARKDA